jgi:large subunit ribosomal protein L21
MFAIINIKGKQYRITENQRLFVPKLSEKTGAKVTFPEVLVYSKDDKTFEIGSPSLKINVQATVLNHIKDDKVIVFKKKRRKGYKRTRGHRQEYTEIEINKIGQKAKESPKADEKSQKEEVDEKSQKLAVKSKKEDFHEKAEPRKQPAAKEKTKTKTKKKEE